MSLQEMNSIILYGVTMNISIPDMISWLEVPETQSKLMKILDDCDLKAMEIFKLEDEGKTKDYLRLFPLGGKTIYRDSIIDLPIFVVYDEPFAKSEKEEDDLLRVIGDVTEEIQNKLDCFYSNLQNLFNVDILTWNSKSSVIKLYMLEINKIKFEILFQMQNERQPLLDEITPTVNDFNDIQSVNPTKEEEKLAEEIVDSVLNSKDEDQIKQLEETVKDMKEEEKEIYNDDMEMENDIESDMESENIKMKKVINDLYEEIQTMKNFMDGIVEEMVELKSQLFQNQEPKIQQLQPQPIQQQPYPIMPAYNIYQQQPQVPLGQQALPVYYPPSQTFQNNRFEQMQQQQPYNQSSSSMTKMKINATKEKENENVSPSSSKSKSNVTSSPSLSFKLPFSLTGGK